MSARNHITLIGNLGGDPELKTFESGNTMVRFSVATSENYKNKQGEKVTETQWHNIVAWGNNAKAAERFLKKGASVTLHGKLTYRQYEKDGSKRTATEIVMESFIPHQYEKQNDSTPPPPAPDQPAAPDDDLPF